jgi:hypothetical protein
MPSDEMAEQTGIARAGSNSGRLMIRTAPTHQWKE